MKRFIPLALIIIALASLNAFARPPKTNEEIIQGTWRLTGQHDTKHSWYLEWTFDQGKFTLQGYPPLSQAGKYRIINTDGNKMTLELYEQSGNFGTENSRIEIEIDKAKDTLTIKGQGPFTRQKVKR